MDNLESATYEVFEKDPIKYMEYERAVALALADSPKQLNIVMVVGAGRGPLVDCVLRASETANKKVAVYAVEKNPNAIVILKQKQAAYWGARVRVFHADMRHWSAPEKADILVSELLGSVGDNELSPECLDGAQRFLKDGGISIPCKYTAYVSPLSSSKLYSEVTAYKDVTHLETPYVVKFKAANELGKMSLYIEVN
ncbi:protein arginine N-methyltransferase [Chytridium lagenaria]|nr:protein arginine N-methyltransferase [Chytridium lagenaria]